MVNQVAYFSVFKKKNKEHRTHQVSKHKNYDL